MNPLATNAALMALLDEGAAFDAEYDDGMSNHLPMALCALAALGADDAQLQRFVTSYSPRLRAARPAARWPAGVAWASRFGDTAAWPEYRQLFTEWLGYESVEDVLAQVLPQLLPGCGAAAFHGLIRTAYAVQAQHAGELADALAHWASSFMAMPSVPQRARTTADLRKLLAALPAAQTPSRYINTRMQVASTAPGFGAAAARLRIDDNTLPALAQHAATLYASTGNFTVLHLVTSAHALRVLLPFAPEPLVAVRHYWLAYAAGCGAAGLAERPTTSAAASALADWPQIIACALASSNDHLIKLVHSCNEEQAVYGGAAWHSAASRVGGPEMLRRQSEKGGD